MIKKYKCTECDNVFTITHKKTHSRIKYKNGVLVDFYTEEPVVEDKEVCNKCGSDVINLLDGLPATKFPLDDLDFSLSQKRMVNGLYDDMSYKSRNKSKELKEEMEYNNEKMAKG